MVLASLLVKSVYVLSPGGTFVTGEQMDTILYSRYVSAKLRRKGPTKSFDNVIDNTF
ncbi:MULTISPECIES: DUF188 domain-containing protein [Bacillus]|uniref:DUF188 domain-containing protein n=1 Tax=Bacillus TaxID=1386 RepID=UPI0008580CF0|nr:MULTISPECIES: DUF188 domain-containing protein [Bacillus]MCU5329454.1 DUF188 domain-containing protein [Bacillus wiedmannii]MCU5497525.1 DUF188 domain-containing protein [Bacillus wiedmannii]MCU5683154.1 DUF188 domain-containing protein [Bacillus wiedmannii]MED2881541.1 DUF188 domain-containing protein [Bacillus wiedmannii]SCM07073.1 Uncharacterized protein BCRIVMBC120_04637 [Bacillus wiedmannii]